MNTALKIIGIISTISGGLGSLAGVVPEKWGVWLAAGGIVLHQCAHTIGDVLDDGKINDSYK
jgi:hypothetical protein